MPIKEGLLDRLWEETANSPLVTGQPKAVKAPLPREQIVLLPLDKLEDFPAQQHPFRPASGARLEELRQDIVLNGILAPLLVREVGAERYQILAGHNRKKAAELAKYDTVPCIIKDVDETEAINIMLSDNLLYREDLLPSEKAFAYKMKLDAMKRQGKRTDLTSSQVGKKLQTLDVVGEMSGDSRNQVHRYIRLTYLSKELLQKVDDQAIGLVIGVTLSYLTQAAQKTVYTYYFVDNTDQHISQSLADELRTIDADPAREITAEVLDRLAQERAEGQRFRTVKVPMKNIRQFFQPGVTKEEAERIIEEAVEFYYNHRQLGES